MNVEDGFSASNPHPAAQRALHLADAASYRKAAAIDPPNRAEYVAGAKDELAAAQFYRDELLRQGAALERGDKASEKAAMRNKADFDGARQKPTSGLRP